jgi:hypothetical protein
MQCPDLVIPDTQRNAQCGSVSQVCQNHKNQAVGVERTLGFPAPTANHFCPNGSWQCEGKTKWSYLAEGKVCGKVTDNCLNQVDLFSCPNERDDCTADHKCVCNPRSVDPSYQCGWQGDGCGRNVTFGTLGGVCSGSEHVCHNHMCCTPKTAVDFGSDWECGTADDGCGGTVSFSRSGSTDNHGCGTGRGWSCDLNHKCQQNGPMFSCSFEENPSGNRFCDFLDNQKGPGSNDILWTRKSGGTPSYGTGPSRAAHGSYYVFTEASFVFNKKALLKSIPFSVSAGVSLAFKYHMYGSTTGSLTVQVLQGGSSTDVWSKSGNQGTSWLEATVDLSSYAGSTIQIVFDGSTGRSYTSDISLDDIEVMSGSSASAASSA